MLSLPRAMVDQIWAHARRDHPDECCGIITGVDGVPARLVEMTNAERSPTGFVFDPAEQLRVWREIDDRDEELLAVYHSHTMTEAYPSRTDIRWSRTAGFAHWVLVSTRTDADTELRSFTIAFTGDADPGVVTEEPVEITD